MSDRHVAAVLLLLSVGCGGATNGATTGRPLHAFPSRAELSELAKPPEGKKPIGADLVAVYDLELELPATHADHPAHALLAIAVPHAKPSAALDCVAHEFGRIVLGAPDKRPDLSVRRFIAARCGALAGTYAFQSWSAPAPASETDDAIVARLRAHLKGAIDASATEAGVAVVRDEQHVVVLVAYGKAQVEVEPFLQVVDASGVLEIRGRVLFETASMQGYVNAGEYGFKPCTLDPAVVPPAFALRCELAADDDSAWVQLTAVPHGRVLGREVLSILALRRDNAATTYHRARKASGPQAARTVAEFEAAALPLVNQIRERAGLGPLRAAPAQSGVASSATPALFAAMLSDDPSAQNMVDRITLGLLAGWEVQGGTIRHGNLITSVVLDLRDAEGWLANAVEQPVGRVVLLAPDAHVLALGTAEQRAPAALFAVATTYAFFEDEDKPHARAMQVLERLSRVRKARGLGRTMLVGDAPGMETELARVHRGEALPMDALQVLLQNVAKASRSQVRGFVWETQDLDAIEFPAELLLQGDLALGAGVTYYRAPGGAWGQYVVLFVVVSPAALKV